ncbi:MAG: energy transducer TonB [Acidobacteria bacterium]|nr:energy transducer TonB [Acidobacteriota bacterium]
MNRFLRLFLGIAFVLAIFAFADGVLGQTANQAVVCSPGAKFQKPKDGNSIISFGVLNARAIELVKPEFSAAARAVNVSGRVTIGILIDPCGRVYEAKKVSGHPLLVSNSINAARRSSFSPVTLSGKPIWVQGIIVYNFRPTKANWLQIGYWSDSAASLNDFLPGQFLTVRRELALDRDVEGSINLDHVKPLIIELIRNDLISEQKSLWLFDTGRTLNQLARSEDAAALARLRELLSSAPQDISPQLKNLLTSLSESGNRSEIDERRRMIEDRMYGLGQ